MSHSTCSVREQLRCQRLKPRTMQRYLRLTHVAGAPADSCKTMRIAVCFLIASVCVVASAVSPATAVTPGPKMTQAPAAQPTPESGSNRLAGLAPADTYFGPFGMSPLSIRSTIGLLGREYHERTISDRDVLRKALITEDALRVWRAKYPADSWLAPTFYHLEQLYQAVQSDEARKHARAILSDVVRNYPNTPQGHLSRSRLAAGFPPLVPETAVVATPQPLASNAPATVDAGAAPQTTPPAATPAAVPLPSSTPTVAPTDARSQRFAHGARKASP